MALKTSGSVKWWDQFCIWPSGGGGKGGHTPYGGSDFVGDWPPGHGGGGDGGGRGEGYGDIGGGSSNIDPIDPIMGEGDGMGGDGDGLGLTLHADDLRCVDNYDG